MVFLVIFCISQKYDYYLEKKEKGVGLPLLRHCISDYFSFILFSNLEKDLFHNRMVMVKALKIWGLLAPMKS
jgi:hypothetical protein